MTASSLALLFTGLGLPALSAIFGAAATALALLYLLKVRRRRLEVPFAALWLRVAAEGQAASLWRRLRRLASLLLQLAILALLVAALADPRPGSARDHAGVPAGATPIGRGEGDARTLVLVVDASASMQATDGAAADAKPESRLERARAEAKRLAAGLGAADRCAVVRLDAEPVATVGLTPASDLVEIERAIDQVGASDGPGDVAAALRLAGDIVRARPRPTVVLLSDGAFDGAPLAAVRTRPATLPASDDGRGGAAGTGTERPGPGAIDLHGVDLRWVKVGQRGDNLAIVAFAARRYPSNKASYEVLVGAASYRDVPTRARLELREEGELVDTLPVELPARGRWERLLPDLAGARAGTHLEARLVPDDPKGDLLAADDRGYALLPPRRKLRVLLVTDGNLFLEGALLLNENLAVDTLPPARYAAAALSGHDAVVFDAFTPPTPPDADAIYVDPQGPGSPIRVAGPAHSVFITDVAEKHPLMRWVALRDLNVARASRFALQPGDVALASSLGEPILVARDDGHHKALALGFDVRRSDLPLRVGFPVLLVNAFEWFAADDTRLESTHPTGRPLRVPVGAAASALLASDEGPPRRVPVVEGTARFRAARAGFYQLTPAFADGRAGSARSLAAQIADPVESRIAPAAALAVDDGLTPLSPPEAAAFTPRARRPPWTLLALLALCLALAEWWTYHRRVTA